MQLIVWKIGDWRKSSKTDGQVKRVIFKPMDKNDKNKQYALNLDTSHLNEVKIEAWSKCLTEGNVLDVVIVPKGVGPVNNDTTINKFELPKVVRDVSNERKTENNN